MDPLSDVLSLLKPRSAMCGGFDIGGDWSIKFPQHKGIKCYSIISGDCRLTVEGLPEPLHLIAGDCFLLPRGLPFVLASDLSLPPVDVFSLFQTPASGAFRTINGGGGCSSVGGRFVLTGKHSSILLEQLPPIVHLRKEADKQAMRWSLERMMMELRDEKPGGILIAQQLSYMILVQALRLHMAEGTKGGVGWLFALADAQMSGALSAMHADPSHPWTLNELAEKAGMSRSVFALRFKQTVGLSPLDYLTRWRMLLAGDRLVNSEETISVIAPSLGYESESAFSTAFKRVMGCSPRQYGRDQREEVLSSLTMV